MLSFTPTFIIEPKFAGAFFDIHRIRRGRCIVGDGDEIVLAEEDLLINMTKKEGFESLGVELTVGATLANAKEWNINGEKVTISVERV